VFTKFENNWLYLFDGDIDSIIISFYHKTSKIDSKTNKHRVEKDRGKKGKHNIIVSERAD
jgi:hypothetical protein